MKKSLSSLGFTDFDGLRKQIDNMLSPVSSVIDREIFSTKRYAEQFSELTSRSSTAHWAREDLQLYGRSVAGHLREAARLDWPNQLAELERISSKYTSNGVLNQITEEARRLTKINDVDQLACSQSAFNRILDHTRELATGTSLQRMLEEEAKRLQRAMAPMPDFGALESAIPQLGNL